MKTQYLTSGILTIGLLLASCGKGDKVSLEVDFGTRDVWRYDFALEVGGRASVGDTEQLLSTAIQCGLEGTAVEGNPSALNVKTKNVFVESAVLDAAEEKHVKERIRDASFTVSLKEGLVGESDTLPLSLVRPDEWSLMRHIIRLAPMLPEGRVSPGYSWERELRIPIETTQGKAVGHLYRSFVFDSLATTYTGLHAHVSWTFSYLVEVEEGDSTAALHDVPQKGKGKGHAIIAIEQRSLLEARVSFTIPQTRSKGFEIDWEEKAFIILLE